MALEQNTKIEAAAFVEWLQSQNAGDAFRLSHSHLHSRY